MEGLQQRKPVPIHIPFPVPSPVPIPSLLSLPRAMCLPVVPYMSPPCSLIVLPDVRGSTDLNKAVQCNSLCFPFLLPSLLLPGSHWLAGKSGSPCHPLGTGQDQTSIPLPHCLPSALSPHWGWTHWEGSCRARPPSPPSIIGPHRPVSRGRQLTHEVKQGQKSIYTGRVYRYRLSSRKLMTFRRGRWCQCAHTHTHAIQLMLHLLPPHAKPCAHGPP